VFPTLLKAMRPKQWAKNVFVFAGLFFDGKALDAVWVWRSTVAFVLFSLVSSAVYLVNDLADIEKDRVHPTKRLRPLASGALRPAVARTTAAALLIVSIPAAFLLEPAFGGALLGYATIMFLYSAYLKNVVIVDVMTVAAGFVLRVYGGTVVVQVLRFSPWLYVCTTLGALFIALNKRRHELVLLAENANGHRSSLQDYSVPFLDEMTALVASSALVTYSFYTFSAPNVPVNHAMMLTIPFVIYGIFRYMYLIHNHNLGGAPEDVVLGDRPLIATLVLWALTAGIVIYGPVLF
jgi:4-hydroxybenzoate polyprenyltransferase